MYECVDKDQESVPGSQSNTDGALFYHVEANCNGMQCPPYNNYKELNCVVCIQSETACNSNFAKLGCCLLYLTLLFCVQEN